MAEIDSLEIKIGASSNTAVEKINALASSLEKLKRTGGGDLSETAKKIEALAKATSSLKGTGEDIKNFAEGLKSLSGLGKIKIPDKLAEKIQALSNAAQGLSSANENITNLGNAAQKLSELGKISIPKNLPDRLHEIGAAMEDITPEAISRLDGMASSLQKLSGIDLKGLPGALRAARSQKSLPEVPETPEMPTAGESDTDFVEPTQVEDTSNKLSILGRAAELAKASIAALEAKFPALAKAIKIAGDAASKFGSALKSAGKAAGSLLLSGIKSAGTAVANDFISPFKNAVKAVSTWKSAIGRIAFYRIVRSAIKAVTDGFKTGIENLYQYSTLVGTSFAPAMNQLATSSLYLKNSLGAMAAPLIQAVAPAIDFVIDKFVALLNVIGKVFAALSGRSTYTQAVKKAATYGEDLDKSMGGAAKSAKDMQHYLLGIDELNVIEAPDDKNNGGGGGGGAGGGFGDMFEEVEIPAETLDWAAQFRKAIEDGEWYKAGEILGNKLNEVVDGLDTYSWGVKLGEKINAGLGIAYGFLKTFDFKTLGAKTAEGFNGIFDTVNWDLLGKTFAAKWNALFDFVYGFSTTLDWASIGRAISDTINGFFAEIDLKKSAMAFSETLKGILDMAIVAVGDLDVATISEKLVSWLGSIDWVGIALRLGALVQEVIAQIPVFILGALAGISESIGDAFANIGLDSIAGFFHGISNALSSAAAWLKEHFVDPIVRAVKDLFGIASPSKVFAEIGGYVIEGFLKGISDTWHTVVDFFTQKLPEWWNNNIKPWFTMEKWTELASPIRETITGAWNNVVTFFSESVPNWWNQNVAPWFTIEKWAELASSISTSVKNAWDSTVGQWATDISAWWDENVAPWFTLEKWESLGKQAINGLFNGLANIWDRATTWGESLLNNVKSVLGIHSPSTVFRDEIGSNLGAGVAEGLENSLGGILSVVSDIAGSVTSAFQELFAFEPKQKSVPDISGDFSEQISNMSDISSGYYSEFAKQISSAEELFKTSVGNSLTVYIDSLNEASEENQRFTSRMETMYRTMAVHSNAAIQSIISYLDSIPREIVTIHRIITVSGSGGSSSGGSAKFARGGFPDEGQMFIAREAGPELVGTIGNRSAVANNGQIEAGIEEAAYRGFLRAYAESQNANQNQGAYIPEIKLYLDRKQLRTEMKAADREAGASIMPGGVVNR